MKAAIQELSRTRLSALRLPKVPKAVEAAGALEPPVEQIEAAPPPDLEQIALRIIRAYREGGKPARRDLNFGPYCLWDGNQPIARLPDVFQSFLADVEQTMSRRLFRRFASTYLLRFPISEPGFGSASKLLQALASVADPVWARASDELHIFDEQRGPFTVATSALAGRQPAFMALERIGVANLPADARFLEIAFLKGLEILWTEPKQRADDQLETVKMWSTGPGGELLFRQHRGAIVDALVLPFAETTPDRVVRDKFIAFLVENFGDPRLHPGHWTPMPQSARVVRRWLTDQSLRQFLDVLDDSALQYQWKYRRAFWEAVYARDLILDAWVVFDKIGALKAKRMFDTEAPFARWEPKGKKQIQSGQACLLLRIGNGIVAEWSHNGRCHIWFDAEDLRRALEVVKRMRDASEEDRREFVKNPRTTLARELGIDGGGSLVTSLFIETKQYSERVTGFGLWEKPSLPWLRTAGIDWLPEKFPARVKVAGVEVRVEQAEPIHAGAAWPDGGRHYPHPNMCPS